MLKPQYTRRPLNVMLFGPALSGKRTLASQLLKSSDVFYQIYTGESIPKKPIARMDYIFVTVDMTQTYSLTLLKQALEQMQDKFLTSKMAVVVTKMDKRSRWQIELEQVQTLVNSMFDVNIFYVNFLNEVEKKKITDQLSRLVKINALQYKNVCTTLLNSVQVYNLDDLDDSEPPQEGREQSSFEESDQLSPSKMELYE